MKSSVRGPNRRGGKWNSLRHYAHSGERLSKAVALAFWGAIIAGYYYYTAANGISALDVARALVDLMQTSVYGPLLYILFYTLQPLIFFPSWLLSLAGGWIYGPLLGTIYTIAASNLSSLVAYATGWFFGRGLLESKRSQDLLNRYATRLREHSFETVLVMRFLFLPYDLVSYLSGFLHIRLRSFIVATILGSLPGTLAFVFAGASIEGNLEGRRLGLNPWVLGFSFGMLVVSLLLWRLFSIRQRRSGRLDSGSSDA